MPSKCQSTAPEVVTAFLEAQRLRQVVEDFKRSNEQSLRFLRQCRDLAPDEPIKTDACHDYCTPARIAPSDAHEERVRRTRDLADKANDMTVRNILLSLAESYDRLGE